MARSMVCIDPGKRTGVAVFVGGNLTTLRTFDWNKELFELMEFIKSFAFDEGARFLIEVPKRGAPGYKRRGVAMVTQKAQTLVALATGFGADVSTVEPNYKFTKVTPAQFSTYFPGWDGRSSSHARDAAMIGWVELRTR